LLWINKRIDALTRFAARMMTSRVIAP